MHSQQNPIVNNWYTNLTGKLFKVRMVSFAGLEVDQLIIEYIDGTKHVISRDEWDCLKLMAHNKKRVQQSQSTEKHNSVEDLVF